MGGTLLVERSGMEKAKLIGKLNEAVALELGALIQYHHYSQVLLGQERRIWQDFFDENSEEAFKHARKFASRVVALGGTPAAEPEATRQTTDLQWVSRVQGFRVPGRRCTWPGD
jgi:bacterioferritin (cytochrome b1)